MGSKSREALFAPPVNETESDAAIKIASTSRRDRDDEGRIVTRHAALRIRRQNPKDPTSPLVYDVDEPVYFDHAIGKSGEFLLLTDEGEKELARYTWFRLEFKADRSEKRIKPGDFLVWAEFPHSNGWVNAARFKRDSGRLGDRRPETDTMAFASGQEFAEWLETLDYDWWETSGKWLTAGFTNLCEPCMPSGSLRNERARLADVLGVCGVFNEDDTVTDAPSFFRACVKELLETQEIKQIQDQTARGTFRFWREGPVDESLVARTLEDGNSLWLMVIRQAMAGPQESKEWEGMPVTKYAEYLYKDHLANIYDRYKRQQDREVPHTE